jgi:hypothetical protein
MTIAVPLANGRAALVDDQDYPLVASHKWYCNAYGYVVASVHHNKCLYMHRLICSAPEGTVVHHRDECPTNNTRSNLVVQGRAEHVRLHLSGRKRSPETIEKVRQALRGRKPSLQARKAAGIAAHRRWQSMDPATREAALANLRHGWPPELRAKVAQSNRGRKRTGSSSRFAGVSWSRSMVTNYTSATSISRRTRRTRTISRPWNALGRKHTPTFHVRTIPSIFFINSSL